MGASRLLQPDGYLNLNDDMPGSISIYHDVRSNSTGVDRTIFPLVAESRHKSHSSAIGSPGDSRDQVDCRRLVGGIHET